ncbi:uncharacterized protein BO80DRAFT_21012 [Aspergillus ibericus CBS 121593]|uniref:Uncharacterized protein n=1 Tax=Aspergillus ibericus CBS 121593 TaxID=1448316 RepID=A0A395H4V7_9EURO|nr:hypothetical protein BO80DRAFT_21012 [Aspergillus ibericus CBS 121593]RAL02907.1 hypothetical protein BO80DRAFT_21012 [Aspergillus ibericus CBS 121593]
MAQARLHQYLSRDTYNTIEKWIIETNAALASHRADLPFMHSAPQPIKFPVSRTHIARVLGKNRPPETITPEMNLKELGHDPLMLKEEQLGRERLSACRPILKMNPEVAAEKIQEQLLAREHWLTPSKRGFEQSAAYQATDLAPTASTAKKARYGYERRPRHKTKSDRYEYRNKMVHARSDRVLKRVKRTSNDTFHAPNVPCDRLTLNHRGIQGIFNKGKASAPVNPLHSGQMPDIFGFDTPLTAWNLHSAHKVGFSESEFLLGNSDTDQVCVNSKSTYEVCEGADSVKYPATSAPKHTNVVSDIPCPAYGCCPSRWDEDVKLLSYHLSPECTFGGLSKPNKAIAVKDPQYYSRFEGGITFQEGNYPSLSWLETAQRVDADERDMRMPEKPKAFFARNDSFLELSGLPDVNTCWRPVSALRNGSSSVAALGEFDYGMILDGGVHKTTSRCHDPLPELRAGSDSRESFSVVEVDAFGEPLERHESRAMKATKELEYEILDVTMVSEAIDCSDIQSVNDLEDCVTIVTHDTNTPSATTRDMSTRGIQECAGPWLERRSPGSDTTRTADLVTEIFDGRGGFWQRQKFY